MVDTNKAVECAKNTWMKKDHRGQKRGVVEKYVPRWIFGKKRKADPRQRLIFAHQGETLENELARRVREAQLRRVLEETESGNF